MLAMQALHQLTVSLALVTEWCVCVCVHAHMCTYAHVCLRTGERVNNHSGITLEVGTGLILLLQ